MFVVIDGPDGVGKTTIIQGLKQRFIEKGVKLECVNDPSSDVDIAKDIRSILKTKCKSMHKSTRLLLYLAARVELLYKSILPAIKEDKLVLCDRYYASTYAYQGMDESTQNLNILNSILSLSKSPDLEIIITRDRPFRDTIDDSEYYNSAFKTLVERYTKYCQEYGSDHKIILYDIQDKVKDQAVEEIFNIINSYQ
jgi:dTMP kinase